MAGTIMSIKLGGGGFVVRIVTFMQLVRMWVEIRIAGVVVDDKPPTFRQWAVDSQPAVLNRDDKLRHGAHSRSFDQPWLAAGAFGLTGRR